MRGRVISLLSLDRAMVTAGASLARFLAVPRGVQLAQDPAHLNRVSPNRQLPLWPHAGHTKPAGQHSHSR
jgi:hypothetical protein